MNYPPPFFSRDCTETLWYPAAARVLQRQPIDFPEESMSMKTILKLLALAILLAPATRAQAPSVAGIAPVLEAGVGYTYIDAGIPSQTSSLAMNGIQLVGETFPGALASSWTLAICGISTLTAPTTPRTYSPTWPVRFSIPCASEITTSSDMFFSAAPEKRV